MNRKAELFCDSRSELGEGPFWHPFKKRIFWFDILNRTLLSANDQGHVVDRITFPDTVSFAGVIDEHQLAVTQSHMLTRYDFRDDSQTPIVAVEPDIRSNRTNDSRVDRAGNFWIGTMSRTAEQGVGGVYHYRRGTVTKIISNITIPNAICFSPDGRWAYFTDAGAMIKRAPLDPETGLPNGPWQDFFASTPELGWADGAVTDSEGFVWSARWGGGKVIRISPEGKLDQIIEVPVSNVSCPAFGGKDMKTLFLTTAREHLSQEDLKKQPTAGSLYAIEVDVPGLVEPLLKL